jgi:type IV pilus assembly protein PilN
VKNPIKLLIDYVLEILSRYSVKKEDVIGLDITPNRLCIAQLSENKNGFVLEKLSTRHVDSSSSIHDVGLDQNKYAEQLKALIAEANIRTSNVAISIPISSAIIQNITLPLMSDDEIKSAIEFDSLWGNIIQLADKLQEYSIFWQVIRRNQAENTMDLLFVASKLTEINWYVQIATKAGLNPVVVDVRCFAARNALSTQAVRSSGTTALIEFGPNENYVLIVTEDSPFIYDIYISESDRLLIEKGIPDGEIGNRLFNRFSDQVRQAFRTYESKTGVPLIEKVWLISLIPDATSLLQQLKLSLNGYRIDLFNPTKNIQIPLNLNEQVNQEKNPSAHSVAIGLATRKVDIFGYYKYVTGVNNVNLLPNREVDKVEKKKKIVSQLGFSFGYLLILFGICIAVYGQYAELNDLAERISRASEIESQIQDKEQQITGINQKKLRYSQMLAASEAFKPNQRFTHLLLESVNRSVPGGVWFSEIAWDAPGTLVIKGDAVSDQVIVDFVNRLQKLSMIERAALQSMNVKQSSSGKSSGGFKLFEIRCSVRETVIEKKSAIQMQGIEAASVTRTQI